MKPLRFQITRVLLRSVCCYWTPDSPTGGYFHSSESCFEMTDVSTTLNGLVHCEEFKTVTSQEIQDGGGGIRLPPAIPKTILSLLSSDQPGSVMALTSQ